MKKKKDKLPSVPNWKCSTSISLKALITEHQDQLPLRQMANKMICNPFTKEERPNLCWLYEISNAQGTHN